MTRSRAQKFAELYDQLTSLDNTTQAILFSTIFYHICMASIFEHELQTDTLLEIIHDRLEEIESIL